MTGNAGGENSFDDPLTFSVLFDFISDWKMWDVDQFGVFGKIRECSCRSGSSGGCLSVVEALV